MPTRPLRLFTGSRFVASEPWLRDYFLHVKLKKRWQTKTIRAVVTASKMFSVDQFGHEDWTVFAQIRTKELLSLCRIA